MIQELNRGLADKNNKTSPNRHISGSPGKPTLIESPETNIQDDEYTLKPSPSKQKYIPSRYGVTEVMQSNQTLSKKPMLNELQQKMESVDDELSKMTPEKINNRLKEMKSYQPPNKTPKVSEFKSKPIKKSENDLLMFKEIFVAPKEKVLHDLREKEKTFSDLVHKGASKQYDRIIGFEKDESKNVRSPEPKLKKDKLHFSTPKLVEKEFLSNTVDLKDYASTLGSDKKNTQNMTNIYKSHDKLQIPPADDDNEIEGETKKSVSNERAFFEQQIQVEFLLNFPYVYHTLGQIL